MCTLRMGSEMHPPFSLPPGSSSCRTLGEFCISLLRLSTTSGVSSKSIPSHTRHPTSVGEKGSPLWIGYGLLSFYPFY